MSEQVECNSYLMRGDGGYVDCRKIGSHVDLHAGPDYKGDLVTWSGGSPYSGRYTSGPGFNRPITPSEPTLQERVDWEVEKDKLNHIIKGLERDKRQLGSDLAYERLQQREELASELDYREGRINELEEQLKTQSEANATMLSRVVEMSEQRNLLVKKIEELEEQNRLAFAGLSGDREAHLVDRVETLKKALAADAKERNEWISEAEDIEAEQRRAEDRANAFQRIAQGYEMLWKGAIF